MAPCILITTITINTFERSSESWSSIMLVTEIRYVTVWPHGLSWRCSNSSGKTLEGHKIAGIFHHSFSDGKSYWEHWSLHLEEIIFIPIFILRGGRFPVIGTLCRRHWGIELPTKSHSAAERTTETNENQCQIKPFFPFSVRKTGGAPPKKKH